LAVSTHVVSAVERLLEAHEWASLLITGHSLGGALATFAGVDIMEQIYIDNSISMYTFGSPRTGNQAWSDYVFELFGADGYQRVTHYNDVVPHLPQIPFGFNHAGNEVWYKNPDTNLSYKVC
jgi:predicted lipase